MATWQEMSLDNLEAARKLFTEDHLRSCISRAYYAAYCAVTAELQKRKIKYPHGWINPAHIQILELVLNNLTMSFAALAAVSKAMRRLRQARESADYRPGVTWKRGDVVVLLRDAVRVARELGVSEDA